MSEEKVEKVSEEITGPKFSDLDLIKPVMKVLDDVGYETPTPIQAEAIPVLLEGHDIVGQAQTGTGKTAAFALPLLSRINLKRAKPQVLVLTPTRELAIQVAEAFQGYAARMKGLHVLPIYGGQDYGGQLRGLRRGVHVVVGTPGRVMDHMRRGTLDLTNLQALVLDEADEMLRMGFIDDVEWILEQTPDTRQIALFSATMPAAIRKIAKKYLNKAHEITIKSRTSTVETINQRYWMVSRAHKLDALTRVLEAETFDGILIFVRTKVETVELAERLEARGYACAPLNGDIKQSQRERTVNRFKAGKIDILIGTDVAARGLDVDRISHVVNYDIPPDPETYVHRVGRTGRAGRSGEAILFVSPRERRLLQAIERTTKQKIALMEMPSTEAINDKRIAEFKQRITDTLAKEGLEFFNKLVESYREEHDIPALEVAAALAQMAQGEEPLLLTKELPKAHESKRRDRDGRRNDKYPRRDRPERGRVAPPRPNDGMERFRLDVGQADGVRVGNIVGCIANEAGLEGKDIDNVVIHDNFTTVDLPAGMPKDIFQLLKKAWVCGRPLNIAQDNGKGRSDSPKKREHGGGKTQAKETRNKSGKDFSKKRDKFGKKKRARKMKGKV